MTRLPSDAKGTDIRPGGTVLNRGTGMMADVVAIRLSVGKYDPDRPEQLWDVTLDDSDVPVDPSQVERPLRDFFESIIDDLNLGYVEGGDGEDRQRLVKRCYDLPLGE